MKNQPRKSKEKDSSNCKTQQRNSKKSFSKKADAGYAH